MTYTPAPGDQLHARRSVSIVTSNPDEFFFIDGKVLERGTSFTLTDHLIRANSDRSGANPFMKAGEEGSPFGIGPWPEGEELWTPGSVEHERARKAAYADAVKIIDNAERAAALQEVLRRYGRAVTSDTHTVENPANRDPQAWR